MPSLLIERKIEIHPIHLVSSEGTRQKHVGNYRSVTNNRKFYSEIKKIICIWTELWGACWMLSIYVPILMDPEKQNFLQEHVNIGIYLFDRCFSKRVTFSGWWTVEIIFIFQMKETAATQCWLCLVISEFTSITIIIYRFYIHKNATFCHLFCINSLKMHSIDGIPK